MIKRNRGQFYETRSLKADSVSTVLKPKLKHVVLLLDTVEKDMDYTKVHAIDSLNSIGWCTMDDVAECLGREAGFKMIAHCEAKVKRMVKEQGLSKDFNIPEAVMQEKTDDKPKKRRSPKRA